MLTTKPKTIKDETFRSKQLFTWHIVESNAETAIRLSAADAKPNHTMLERTVQIIKDMRKHESADFATKS